jgi:hypothetical protein
LHADWEKNPDGALLFDHREGSECDLDDDEALLASLAEAYGAAAEWMDLERIMREEFRSDSVNRDDSVRYFLNRRVDHSDDFLPVDVFDASAKPDRKVPKGARITVGFDGSDRGYRGRRADSTVLRGCDLDTGHLFTLGMWEHPVDVDEWEVPRDEVRACLRRTFDEYDVVRFYADPPYWEAELDELAGDVGADVVVKWWTNRYVPMASALDLLSTSLRNGEITHDGDKRVRSHYAHAKKWIKPAPKNDPDGRKELTLVRKPVFDGPLKIDTVVVDALAVKARSDAIAGGARRKKQYSYTFR